MSLDTLFDARRFTNNARLMSRMALIASGQTYPYDDKESIISRAKEFLEVALKEGNFLGTADKIDVYASHFDPLQPITLSAKALDKESATSDFDDLAQQLNSILESVHLIEEGRSLPTEDIRKNKKFFTSLQDCFNALANDELFESVAPNPSETMVTNRFY